MGPFLFHDEMLSGPIIYKYYIGNQSYYEFTSSEYIMTGKYIFFSILPQTLYLTLIVSTYSSTLLLDP